jgi:NACalpha-BTF3-like transcription factor
MAEPTTSTSQPTPSNFPGDTVATSASETAKLSDAASKLKLSEDVPSTNGASKTVAKVDTKKVKVDPKDVEFLVKELEVTKVKATEMLKAANGEKKEAVKTYVVGVCA